MNSQAKFDKQFKYAERKNIGHVVMIGSEELATARCTLKNLSTGTQESILQSELLQKSF
jgi:histidyl-tRNA synthetase